MDFRFTPEQEALRQQLREFFKRELPEDEQVGEDEVSSDEQWQFVRRFQKKLARRGWLVPHWPKQYGGADMGIFTIIVYITVQTVDGNILVPLIAKKTVDLAPAMVLGMQLVMGVLFGILGLALADPLLAMLKVALERRSAKYDAEAAAIHTAEA